MRLQNIINTKNFNKLLKPFTLARLILFIAVLSISTYGIICSTPENITSMVWLNSTEQIILGVAFLLTGVEEVQKQDGKKFNAYIMFVFAFILTVLNIWRIVW